MNKENIIDYVLQTPHNPNKKVLDDMLETLIEESGGTDNLTYSWNDLTDKPFGEVNNIEVIYEDGEYFIDLLYYQGIDLSVVYEDGEEIWATVEERYEDYDYQAILVDSNGVDITNSGFVKIYFSESETRQLEERYIPDTISRADHTHSWNELNDKPFGEEPIVIFDNTTSDILEIEYNKYDNPFAKISEVPVSAEDIIGWSFYMYERGGVYLSYTVDEELTFIDINENCISYGGRLFFSVFNTFEFEGAQLTPGIWIIWNDDYYVAKIEKPGPIKTLDEQYIPETIARVSDIPEGASGSWDDLKDKPFGEIVDSGILCEDMSWNGIIKYDISVGKWKKCDELIPNIVSVVNKLNGIENTIVGYENKPGHLAISEDNRVVYGYEENTLRYLIILEDNVTTTVDSVELTFTQSGFYVNIGVEGTYPVTYSYTQFKTIDENVIPETIARIEQVAALLAAFEITVEDIDEICGATSTETILDEAILGETTV